MNKPVRTTIVFGLASGLLLLPAAWLMTTQLGWPLAFKLSLWADAALYALLLARWTKTRLLSILFPLLLLLGAALWPHAYAGFFLLGLGILSWIRSGICFMGPPLRRLTAEVITVVGGAGIVAMCGPGSHFTWALAVWLFFLVQALYFFIVPSIAKQGTAVQPQDPFLAAMREAEKTLEAS